jgi:hypothetical protein
MGERGRTALALVTLLAACTACTAGAPRAVPPAPAASAPATPDTGVAPPPAPRPASPHRPRIAAESPVPWATTAPPSPSPSAPSYVDWWTRQENDGVPGWSSGFSGCSVPRALPEPGTPPFKAGIALRLDAPATFEAGQTYTLHAVVTNTGGRYVHFGVSVNWVLQAVLLDKDGHGNRRDWGDAIGNHYIDLGPGEETSLDVRLDTSTCGDGPRAAQPPLRPGTYRLGFGVEWQERAAGPSPSPVPDGEKYESGEWGIAPLTVTVT